MYVGRAIGCQIDLNDISVSRRHCVFHFKEYAVDGNGLSTSGFCIYDLKSTHGTFLNDERVPQMHNVKLRHGDRLKFGAFNSDFIFEDLECGRSESVETAIGEPTQNTVHSTTETSERTEQPPPSVDQTISIVNTLVEQLREEKKKVILHKLKAGLETCIKRIMRDSTENSVPDTTELADELEAELGRLHAPNDEDLTQPLAGTASQARINELQNAVTPLVVKSQEPPAKGHGSKKKIQVTLPQKQPKQKAKAPEPTKAKHASAVAATSPETEPRSDNSTMITKRIGPISSKIIVKRSLQLLNRSSAAPGEQLDPLAGFDVDPFAAIPDNYVLPRASSDGTEVPAPIKTPKVEGDNVAANDQSPIFRTPKQGKRAPKTGAASIANNSQTTPTLNGETTSPQMSAHGKLVKKRQSKKSSVTDDEEDLNQSLLDDIPTLDELNQSASQEDIPLSQLRKAVKKQKKATTALVPESTPKVLPPKNKGGRPRKTPVNFGTPVATKENAVAQQSTPAEETPNKRIRKRKLASDESPYEDVRAGKRAYTQSQPTGGGNMNETLPPAKKKGRPRKYAVDGSPLRHNISTPTPLSVPTAAARKQHNTPELGSTGTPSSQPKRRARKPKNAAAAIEPTTASPATKQSPIKLVISFNKQKTQGENGSTVLDASIVSNTSNVELDESAVPTKKIRGPYKKKNKDLPLSNEPPKTNRRRTPAEKKIVPELTAAPSPPSKQGRGRKRVSFPQFVEYSEEQRNQLMHFTPKIVLEKIDMAQLEKLTQIM